MRKVKVVLPFIAAASLALTTGCGPNGDDREQDPICQAMTPQSEVQNCLVESFSGGIVDERSDLEPLCTARCDTVDAMAINWLQVPSLRPLTNVRVVQGGFRLEAARQLRSLDGVQNIERVGTRDGFWFEIRSTHKLKTTDGFDSLEEVSGRELWLGNNLALEDASGFPSLRRLNGRLNISDNPELRRISGFQNLDIVDGDILIEDNPKLPRCEAEKLVERIGTVTGEVTIRNNGEGSCE